MLLAYEASTQTDIIDMLKAIRTCFITTTLLLMAPVAQAELYAFSDATGATTYTDRPTAVARSSSSSSKGAKGISIGAQYQSRKTELSTDALSGTWRATSQDGMHTRFEVRPNGTFVFDQRDTHSPERTWMCGSVRFDSASVNLALSESKHRDAEGTIEQQLGESQTRATVVSASGSQLVLRIDGETMIFQRVAGVTS